MKDGGVTDTENGLPGVRIIDEEEYNCRLQIEREKATRRIKRIFILMLTELFLVVGLYFLMLALPKYALTICLVVLCLMFVAMGLFLWNEVTYNHTTKEVDTFHYHTPTGTHTSEIIGRNE